jgi:SAM-dependent methyltransferase
MSRPTDAVDLFSSIVREFHGHYADRPEFQERLKLWCELLERHSTGKRLAIDIGCGTGVLTFLLAERVNAVIGIDGAPEMVAFCEEQRRDRGAAHVRFMQGRLPDVDEAPLRGADLVISSSVVEYVDDFDSTLAMFARVLAAHGTLIVSMPNAFSVSRLYERLKYRLTGQPEVYRHIRHFSSPHGLARRLRRHGFALQDVRYYAHNTRVARLARRLGLGAVFTEDLFVAVFER